MKSLTSTQIKSIGQTERKLRDVQLERIAIPGAFNLLQGCTFDIYVPFGYSTLVTHECTTYSPLVSSTVTKKPGKWRCNPVIAADIIILLFPEAVPLEVDTLSPMLNVDIQERQVTVSVKEPASSTLEIDLLFGDAGCRFSLLKSTL